MKLSKSMMCLLALILAVGTPFVFAGCATCCGDESPAPAAPKASGHLRGTLGCDDCEKASSPLFIEKAMPGQIVVGKPYQYTIEVTNQSQCSLDEVTVIEQIPAIFNLESANPEATKVSGQVAQWDLGYLKPKETRLITITGTAKGTGSLVSCTKASYTPVLCLGPEAISPDLKLALEIIGEAILCDTIPAKVTITNTGTGYAQDAVINLPLPEGLTTADGKSSVSIKVGDLAGGDAKSYAINLKAKQPGSYSVKANAAAANDLSAASNTGSVNVTQCALQVSIQGPEKVFVTKNASYKVMAQNRGNADAANTVVTASIPAGMKFVQASDGGSVSGSSVVWNIGTLGAGKAVELDATFNAVTGGTGRSIATAKGYCCQEASSDVQTSISGISALLLEAIDTEDPIQVGNTEKFYVTVTNQGSAPDTNIKVKVDFEDQFDYVSSNGPTQAKGENAKSVEFAPLGSLNPGQKATWEIVAKATGEGDHRTSIKLTSDVLSRSVDETESTHVY